MGIHSYRLIYNLVRWPEASGSQAIATDKRGYPHNIFLISPQNICCGYSLEAPRWGASNEYHNICFCGEIRKISAFFGWKKRLICCYRTGSATLLRVAISSVETRKSRDFLWWKLRGISEEVTRVQRIAWKTIVEILATSVWSSV